MLQWRLAELCLHLFQRCRRCRRRRRGLSCRESFLYVPVLDPNRGRDHGLCLCLCLCLCRGPVLATVICSSTFAVRKLMASRTGCVMNAGLNCCSDTCCSSASATETVTVTATATATATLYGCVCRFGTLATLTLTCWRSGTWTCFLIVTWTVVGPCSCAFLIHRHLLPSALRVKSSHPDFYCLHHHHTQRSMAEARRHPSVAVCCCCGRHMMTLCESSFLLRWFF